MAGWWVVGDGEQVWEREADASQDPPRRFHPVSLCWTRRAGLLRERCSIGLYQQVLKSGCPHILTPTQVFCGAALAWSRISILHLSLASHEEAADHSPKCPALYLSPSTTSLLFFQCLFCCLFFLSWASIVFPVSSWPIWSQDLAWGSFLGIYAHLGSQSPRLAISGAGPVGYLSYCTLPVGLPLCSLLSFLSDIWPLPSSS